MGQLQAGYAVADFTPRLGSMMGAFPLQHPRTPRRAVAVHDPLQVRALALSDGSTTVCLAATDVLTWQACDVDAVRRAVVAERPELRPEALLLTATHTHASIENSYLFGGSPESPEAERLRRQTVRAVLRAVDDLQPATFSFGFADAPYNCNRRFLNEQGRAQQVNEYAAEHGAGTHDPRLSVLRFERPDSALCWLHWTAHALTLGPANQAFSADYPGALIAAVEAARPGTRALFTNGAAGNIHARQCMRADDTALDWLTSKLTPPALGALDAATAWPEVELAVAGKVVSYPNRPEPSLTSTAEVSCLRLASPDRRPLAIGFFPGEPFVEFQLRFREALPDRDTILVGYAGGWAGYVPTRESYPQGGYGVDLHPTDPPELSRTQVPAGTGERFLETLVALAGGKG